MSESNPAVNCDKCNKSMDPMSSYVTNQCGHHFHENCFTKLIKTGSTCPACGSALKAV